MYLEVNGWKSGLRFAASHFIPGHPKCGRLHGHCYAVHLRIRGRLGANGLILDFSQIKHIIRPLLEQFDHRVLIPTAHSALETRSTDDGAGYEILAENRRYVFPKEDVILLDIAHSTVEALAEHILALTLRHLDLPPTVDEIQLGLDEGPGQGAWVSRSFGHAEDEVT